MVIGSACNDIAEPPALERPPGSEDVTVRFCAGDSPHWFAFRNEGRDWNRIQASILQTAITFPALERLTVAWGRGLVNTQHSELTILHLTREEAGQLRCGSPIGDPRGTLRMTGTAQVRDAADFVTVAMAGAFDLVLPGSGRFDLIGLPAGKADLVALAQPNGTVVRDPLLIVRHDIDVVNLGAISLVDFTGPEARPPASATVTVSNVTPEFVASFVVFRSKNGTVATLGSDFATGAAVGIAGVDPSQLVAGDQHSVSVTALASDAGGQSYRDLTYAGAAVKDTAVEMGPALLPTVLDTVSVTPLFRMRVRQPKQPEYASAADAEFIQIYSGGVRMIRVGVSAGFSSGSSDEWDLEIPDLTVIKDFPSSWMLQPELGTLVSVRATDASIASITAGPFDFQGQSTRGAYRMTGTLLEGVGTHVPFRYHYRGGRLRPVSTVGR